MSEWQDDPEWCESDAVIDAWPNCPTPDCHHKVCLWSGTGHCHPCSVRLVGQAEMDRRYDATHTEPPR